MQFREQEVREFVEFVGPPNDITVQHYGYANLGGGFILHLVACGTAPGEPVCPFEYASLIYSKTHADACSKARIEGDPEPVMVFDEDTRRKVIALKGFARVAGIEPMENLEGEQFAILSFLDDDCSFRSFQAGVDFLVDNRGSLLSRLWQARAQARVQVTAE